MIWFYERGDQHLFYEVRLREDGPGYELGLASPEGPLLTECFAPLDGLSRGLFFLLGSVVGVGGGPVDRRPAELAADQVRRGQRVANRPC